MFVLSVALSHGLIEASLTADGGPSSGKLSVALSHGLIEARVVTVAVVPTVMLSVALSHGLIEAGQSAPASRTRP